MSQHSQTSDASLRSAPRKERCLPASQIAKDVSTFETWSSYQDCEEVDFSIDLPDCLSDHVDEVFDLDGRLPESWVDTRSKDYRKLKRVAKPAFLDFLQLARAATPKLFSDDVSFDEDAKDMLHSVQMVFNAWQSVERMRGSSRKWSEADYAGVYELVRRSAIQCGEARAQCEICLPQPSPGHKVTAEAVRVLGVKKAKPDGALFIPARLLTSMCKEEQSPYKVLYRASRQKTGGGAGGESSFRYQSTICARLPDACIFEIASTFWEDKKPSHHELEAAYRQNRMATTAALRQLHALQIEAPVFGIVWAERTVRVHADWWRVKEGRPRIYSAAYDGGLPRTSRRESVAFHEWDLSKPGDIIEVFLLMRNLDRWTTGTFHEAVVTGITKLAKRAEAGDVSTISWRRKGNLNLVVGRKVDPEYAPPPEPTDSSTSFAEASPPSKCKSKKRKPRASNQSL
ncbi:hypothetical protein C8Q79DRAFT_1005504 [Trametes meyenii]|nr:hypothetical protein C8Q79DRAFT_1005504 [Trametes meyenii]